MSKKVNDKIPSESNVSEAQGDTFSFLELNKFLANENREKEHNNNKNKSSKKRISHEKEESEKKQKLKIKPNINIAREQTSDDMMYIENDDLNQKEEVEKEEKEEKKEIIKEKSITKKPEEKKKAKADRRVVKLNLNMEKSEEKQKPKDEEKGLDSDKKDEKNKKETPEGYTIESFINKIKENDPQAYTPIILPFEKDNAEEKSLKDELVEDNEENKNKLFVFQFPRQIPIKGLEDQIRIKEEENVNEEPEYDKNGFLISPEFKNSFQEIDNKTVIGKLVIMKSGKIKIKMGDIYFDVNQGSLTKFAQFATVISKDNNQAYILGQPLNKKLIVTPEFD